MAGSLFSMSCEWGGDYKKRKYSRLLYEAGKVVAGGAVMREEKKREKYQ